jgi:hypothetical protein
MILISKVWEEVGFPDSPEGDQEEPNFEDSGFEFTDEPMTFRDLVYHIVREGHTMPSCYPPDGSTFEWLSAEPELDYSTGIWKTTSLHYAQKNHPRNAKYWRKAMIVAGIVKQ